MSLDCRILRRMTDGKIYYYYRDSVETPPIIQLFDKLDEVSDSIRGYFDKKEIQDVGPDFACFLRIQNKLYPNFPNCGHPGYPDTRCIAEFCKYAPDKDWRKCPYFKT